MNTHALIPLAAAVAYLPLLVILFINRPWQNQQRLFFLFLLAASFWSLADIFARSDYLMTYTVILAKLVLFGAIWMVVQYHYLLRTFYTKENIKIPFGYILLAAFLLVEVLGYIPASIEIQPGGINVDYGDALVFGFAPLLAYMLFRDLYFMLRRRMVSTSAVERNQISYIFLGFSFLFVFGILTIALPAGGEYPVAHFGNLGMACILTYAVVTHRLVDIRVIFRQAIVNVVLYGGGIGLVLLVFGLAQRFIGFESSLASILVTIAAGIPAILLLTHKVGTPWRAKIEEAFIGERYHYRRLLSQFVTQIQSVANMEQFGSDFVSLLSQSIGCHRACLLLPQAEDGAFVPRSTYPPVQDNPMKDVRLRSDNPIVDWLKQQRILLPERNVSIYPEFKSVWQEERETIRLAGVEVFVPLVNMDDLVGILAIGERRDGRPYTVEDFDLLNSIAAQVAASMEKEYIYEQLREQGKEISLINHLTTIFTSSVNIKTIFESFVQELKKVMDFDWVTIALLDGEELCFLALSSTVGSPWQAEERIPLEGTATQWVCREGKSLYETDLAQYRRFWTGEHHLQQGIHSIVYLPLIVKDQSIGSLIVGGRHADAFSSKQIRLLEQVALQIATPIVNSQLYSQAELRSRVDELTGLFNRRHFEERLKEEIARHSRYGDVFSIFLLDLDNFKTYNDVYGHPSGDTLLSHMAKLVRTSVRNADQAFRYGGDEFVVILPQTSTEEARVVAERVRERIAGDMEKKEIAVTCSIGLASYPSDGVMAGEIVTVADTALYFAKRTGGNRVYLSSKILSEPLDDAGIYARRNGLSAIYALVSTVEAKDPYTYGHSRKVNTYAVALAEAIGLSPEDVSRVSTAALLHDIGKIGVPDKVLNKKGKLNAEDWEAIKSHPRLGANIVGNVPSLAPCVSTILHHHERWDGTGYPEGLKGEQISIEARILAIADAFEAMSSPRPYRPALCSDKVLRELRSGAGSQFDPELVEVFIGIIEAGLPDKVNVGQEPSDEHTAK
jgi:diguanylate cyclase (GGDEF)-like protein/putative nucleotidyltransferase with HDIG domain